MGMQSVCHRTAASRLAIALLCTASGCTRTRPETAPVTGKVALDGWPIEGAMVIFTPAGGGRPAMGQTDVHGEFALSTFSHASADGALLGQHLVAVTKVAPTQTLMPGSTDGLPPPATSPAVVWLTPKRYSHSKTSGLTATVAEEGNQFVFELVSVPR